MRLLNTSTMHMKEFFDVEVPKYAILSHRWENDEVSLQEYLKRRNRKGLGYQKIIRCCKLAAQHGHQWIWIDTCCIDKKSSAELSEAINSMFRWYERAEVCYAYLSDVTSTSAIQTSRWFTRGWTLQELLAPKLVLFCDGAWNQIGDKTSLKTMISSVTGISDEYLEGEHSGVSRSDPASASVATKMSWASRRETSRTEDGAYSLMGLFGVHMSLLYGEGGQNAFRRLQEEIIKRSDDESIFAWHQTGPYAPTGVLAASPSQFGSSSRIETCHFPGTGDRASYGITHKGLQMEVRLTDCQEISLIDFLEKPRANENHRWLRLNCKGRLSERPVALIVVQQHHNPAIWQRIGLAEAVPRLSLTDLKRENHPKQIIYLKCD